ncbi:low molecular weight protein-tyrosine-phosphatase [Paucilactobacillus suebicus]|uniref:protein-tyrosine-phosphatase n=1 Tax=Paucilactobacillus suebicus DSM 5007 = KCTC 3549 TaxID=1423807 RepID=A0A0R1W1A3_9LACO|nr:low molecular weight protein-tyrosine-phosphatase [Paucilactobacillus suebicus]KRM08966.1 phosphotyrosine protein phosphatase [Paucilactobacillus suebicus DSM 5007 = KCTC 3549]
MTKVLFVCLGNICRSPMAEAMFRKMVSDNGLSSKITVDSAGTSNEEEGNPMHPGARKIMHKYNLPTDGLISRPLNYNDFENSDYIICMDDMNMRHTKQMSPIEDQKKIHAIFDLIPNKKGQEIPDPWYTHRFQDTYDSLASALPSWLNLIKTNLNH